MRFSLDPVGDLEVTPGTRLAEVRGAFAALTGVAALADAPLRAGRHDVPGDAVAGVEPWVEGSTLRVDDGCHGGAAPWPPHPRWWLAVVDGPAAGLVAGARRTLTVRPADVAGAGPAEAGQAGEPATGLMLCGTRGGALTRVAGLWWWRPAHGLPRPVRRVRLGEHVLEPVLARAVAGPAVTPAVTSGVPAVTPAVTSRGPAVTPTGSAWLWLAPAVASLAAAALWRSPVLALLAVGSLAPVLGRLPHRATPFGPGPAATLVARERGEIPALPWWSAAESGLALVGPRAATLAAARTLVGAAVLDPQVDLVTRVAPDRDRDWRWCRWLDAGGAAVGQTRRLVVVDGGTPPAPEPGTGVLVLVAERSAVPAGCRHQVRVGARRPDGPPGASATWAEAHARGVAGLRAAGTASLPRQVALADLDGPGPGEWSVPIGVSAGGAAVCWDMVADGPHLLVAGTTGSGKSELLQSVVLALARRHPADRVAFVLVDFKGGAGLAACQALPHVAGVVTDLDPALAARVLAGVRVELRQREQLLAEAGLHDLEALRAAHGHAPPRLVVVVDELLALRDDLPGVLPALVRLASQGRSLGIHLVLATQRPAGALDSQVRANLTSRICLRVADPADSLDVLDVPRAADLPRDLPGRALVRRDHGQVEEVQVAWAALRPSAAALRWARRWPASREGREPADHLPVLVSAAARSTGSARPLWRPPLPARVTLEDVPRHLGSVHGTPPGVPSGLLLGLVDRPDQCRTDPLVWRPELGPYVVVGPRGSGRTTALRALAQAATAAGRAVHVLHGGSWSWPHGAVPELRGTVVGADDPPRLLRLVELLIGRSSEDVVLVDDLAAVVAALARVPRGVADDALARLRTAGVPLAVAGSPRDARPFDRPGLLVELDGEPVALGGPAPPPGAGSAPRAPSVSGAGYPALPGRGQVGGLACRLAVPSAATRTDLAGLRTGQRLGRPGAPAPVLRLPPLPTFVPAPDVAQPEPSQLLVGPGGDHGAPLWVHLRRGLLVVGPVGSGRSGVAALVRRLPGAHDLDPARPGGGPGVVAVLDDADVVLRSRLDLDDLLTGWVHAAEAGDSGVPRLVLTARTDRAAGQLRGAVGALRTAAPVLVLDPRAPGSSEVAGVDLSRFWLPGPIPGRAVLVDRGTAVPVQVAST